jgi:hypothetical protein
MRFFKMEIMISPHKDTGQTCLSGTEQEAPASVQTWPLALAKNKKNIFRHKVSKAQNYTKGTSGTFYSDNNPPCQIKAEMHTK